MKNISRIEIQYFRSIYRANINDLKDLNVLTGKNDVGKSNVLKALNLFFNNSVYDNINFDFKENFNKIRAEEVRKDSIKGKQFIQIKITFNRGLGMNKTLPEQFTVSKKWLRYDEFPIVTDDLELQCKKANLKYNDRTKTSLTKFLKSIKYIYIPAIKDSKIFNKVLGMLQETLYDEKLTNDKGLVDSLNNLSNKIQSSAKELNSEFYNATNISANISSPKDITEFYNTLSIDTLFANNFSIKLDNRGDGIRVRYLPSILNYLAINIKKNIIWGFEEPENSVEYNLAIKMAKSFAEDYSKKSMIFLTSHSPAFINLKGENVQLFRCFNEENKTNIYTAKIASSKESIALELGYLKIQEELYKDYLEKKQSLDNSLIEIKKMRDEIKSFETPVVLTEGKTDVQIIKVAWQKLYPDKSCPFNILSCDATGDGQSAGCEMLKNYLTSYRFDSPHITIGIFDRDLQGIKAFELSKNFVSNNTKLYKQSKNHKAFAFLLPDIDEKKEFIKYKNFCIEFMFNEEYLTKKIDGKGLVLNSGVSIETYNGVPINKQEHNELWFKTIESNSKNYFAEKVVPTFPTEAFNNFKYLFDIIYEIIGSVEVMTCC